MNKPSSESLKVNPFTTVRDPETGIWLVCFPDGTVKNSTMKDGTMKDGTVKDGTVKDGTVKDNSNPGGDTVTKPDRHYVDATS